MDINELRPGLVLVGSLDRIEPVRRGQSKGGEAIEGFWQLVISTADVQRVRPTFNECDRETGEPTPVWRALEGVEAAGQRIVIRVAADVRQFQGAELVRVLDSIRNGAGVEALRGLVGKWINYRALSVVWLGEVPALRESA